MKIKDITDPALKALALQRQVEQGNEANEHNDLVFAFKWEYTREGKDFWDAIDERKIISLEGINRIPLSTLKTFYAEHKGIDVNKIVVI